MSCETWRPLIMEAAEKGLDALDRAARDRLTSHLTQCVECQAALEDQQAVRDALNARVDAPVPTGFALRVLAGVTAGPSVNPERAWVELLRWRTWSYRLAPLAAGLLLFGVMTARNTPAETPVELSELGESWAFDTESAEGRPIFTLWGYSEVDGAVLLDAILSAEPDEPLTERETS